MELTGRSIVERLVTFCSAKLRRSVAPAGFNASLNLSTARITFFLRASVINCVL